MISHLLIFSHLDGCVLFMADLLFTAQFPLLSVTHGKNAVL